MVKRKPDNLLQHVVCRNHTHTDLNLHAGFYSHPSQKCTVLATPDKMPRLLVMIFHTTFYNRKFIASAKINYRELWS
jgi:hypothetical protein